MRRILPALLAVLAVACSAEPGRTGSSSDELRELSEAEVLADLETLGATIRASYGPLDYKHELFGLDLDHEMDLARARVHEAKTEGERLRALYVLTGQLRDLHVSLTAGRDSDGAAQKMLPVTLAPVEDGKYAITVVQPWYENPQVAVGDVVTSFDGASLAELETSLATFADYGVLTSSRERWASHLVNRKRWMPDVLQPKGETAKVGIERADGTKAIVELPWTRKLDLAEQLRSFLPPAPDEGTPAAAQPRALPISPQAIQMQLEESQPRTAAPGPFPNAPFFYNETVANELGLAEVKPSIVPETATGLGAVKYSYNGKTLLLLRIPTWNPPDIEANLDWIHTLLMESQQGAAEDADVSKRPIDAVIIDETHNGGGTPSYVQGVASMFVTDPIPGDSMSFRADRKWLDSFASSISYDTETAASKKYWTDGTRALESAIDSGATVSPLMRDPYVSYGTDIPVGDEAYGPTITAHPKGVWKGPTVVLVSSRSVSAADMFPMVMQNGHVATIFGTQTAGGGGMVEQMLTLTNTGLAFHCTRGFFGAYPTDGGPFRYIENNGVVPDVPHPLTAADVRGKYVDYVKHFSEVASTLKR